MRDFSKPIARVNSNGDGIAKAVGVVHWSLHYEGEQRVFMDDHGHVYCAPVGTLFAERTVEQHLPWFIGTYVIGKRSIEMGAQARRIIAEGLNERLRELVDAAA